jgi:hypothetical protein
MADSPPEEKWPEYHPGNRKDILALGVIALNYGQLERMYRIIFSYVTGLNEYQTAALFHRLPNNQRRDVLYELMAKTVMTDELIAAVKHFGQGFGACLDNRNDIMHSFSSGRHRSESPFGPSGIVLSKYTKAGDLIVCYANVGLLRIMADEMHTYSVYGSFVAGAVREFNDAVLRGDDLSLLRLPLRDKPPSPTRLTWQASRA